MNQSPQFDRWRDRHVIPIDPKDMDRFPSEDNFFSEQPAEMTHAIEDALENMQNSRYRLLLTGLYRDKLSPKVLAEEMGVSLSNFYNLHHRALARLKAIIYDARYGDE